jgi:hypothetical protein
MSTPPQNVFLPVSDASSWIPNGEDYKRLLHPAAFQVDLDRVEIPKMTIPSTVKLQRNLARYPGVFPTKDPSLHRQNFDRLVGYATRGSISFLEGDWPCPCQ